MDIQFCFIANARIGEKKLQELRTSIQQYFTEHEAIIHVTQFGGHARVLAQDAVAQNIKTIIAVGGDGTVNEVMQELVHTNSVLGIVPTGSGNGLARHCSIPLKINEAVKLIASGKVLKIDIGKANAIYFISNAGVGFDAWVCNRIKETKSRGLKMYIKKVVQSYFGYQSAIYQITADGKTFTQEAFFLNVANGKEFGYGFEIAPNANLQDGYLDMILVKKINAFTGFSFVWDGWRKKLNSNKNCIYIRTKKISISSSQLKYMQTDGDAHDCNGTCEIEIHAASLQLIVQSHIESL